MSGNILTKSIFFLVAIGSIYAALLISLTFESVQANAVYLHKLTVSRMAHLKEPEKLGFAAGQVSEFFLATPDGEQIHAWHIVQSWQATENHIELVAKPDSHIVIFFHGNAGTMVAGHRPDAYRAILSGSPNTQVLTIDYRGFGLSSGTPYEEGLIMDGMTIVHWALSHGVKARNIVIAGQSLGSAVAIAVSERLSQANVHVRLTMPIAAFSNIRTLLQTYRILRFIPLLEPIRTYPWAQEKLSTYLVHTWESAKRIAALAGRCKTKIVIVHSPNDLEIPFSHANTLFEAAVNGSGKGYRPIHTELKNEGSVDTIGQIQKVFLHYGGHNMIIKASRLGILVADAFSDYES